MKVVEINDLYKEYRKGSSCVKAVNHVSFSIERGEFLAIIGTSGSGKSTLLNLIGGLDHADSGTVLINGREITAMSGDEVIVFRRKNIGFIFQEYNLLSNFNVKKNITLPIRLDKKKPDIQMFEKVTVALGLKDKLSRYPAQLSGGEQQRVAIARSLLAKPAIILADEPTGSLDSKTTNEVLQLLKVSCSDFRQTLVMITHNRDIARVADRVIKIEDGKLISDNTI